MKYLILLIILVSLCGCASPYRGASAADEFDCKQKCGYYDMHQNPIASGMCINNCIRSRGY
jgi:hypothetical protein